MRCAPNLRRSAALAARLGRCRVGRRPPPCVGPARSPSGQSVVGNDTEVSVPFTVANGEQIAARASKAASGSRSSKTRALGRRRRDGARCASASRRRRRARCTRPCTSATQSCRLNAAAYGVGPSLEASPSQLEWSAGPRADGSVDAVRSIRVINRGDEPVRVRRLSIADATQRPSRWSRPSAPAGGSRPASAARRWSGCRSPGGARRAELRIATELPQAPYAVSMRTVADSDAPPPRPMCPCATLSNAERRGQAWTSESSARASPAGW